MHTALKTFLISLVVLSGAGFGILGYLEHANAAASPVPQLQPEAVLVANETPADSGIFQESESTETVTEEPEAVKEDDQKDLSDRSPTDYVDIRDIDDTIIVRPVFLEMPLMTGKDEDATYRIVQTYEKAVLRKATAEKLRAANQMAIEKYGCCIRVYEAYRAVEVQSALREHFINTAPEELQSLASRYIASPGYSKHQFGVAVDLTLVDLETGEELKMPSDYLAFTPDASAKPKRSDRNKEEIKNMKMLQDVMVHSGFEIYVNEWWHFNDMETAEKVEYEVISPDNY